MGALQGSGAHLEPLGLPHANPSAPSQLQCPFGFGSGGPGQYSCSGHPHFVEFVSSSAAASTTSTSSGVFVQLPMPVGPSPPPHMKPLQQGVLEMTFLLHAAPSAMQFTHVRPGRAASSESDMYSQHRVFSQQEPGGLPSSEHVSPRDRHAPVEFSLPRPRPASARTRRTLILAQEGAVE